MICRTCAIFRFVGDFDKIEMPAYRLLRLLNYDKPVIFIPTKDNGKPTPKSVMNDIIQLQQIVKEG